ncbi:MAG: hypothetical protein AABX31_01270 [Nanoarchaeota archaeon]
MADFYYVSGIKIPLEHRLGYYTVGLSDSKDYDEMTSTFSARGLKVKKINLKNRFLVFGESDLTASDVRQDIPFTTVPFITKTYQQVLGVKCVVLLEDQILVEDLPRNPSKMKEFLSTYELHLIEDSGDYHRFGVSNPDEDKALAVAAKIYEDTRCLVTPRFKRVMDLPDKVFDFDKFFSS